MELGYYLFRQRTLRLSFAVIWLFVVDNFLRDFLKGLIDLTIDIFWWSNQMLKAANE